MVPLVVLAGEQFETTPYDLGASLEESRNVFLGHPKGEREPLPGRHSAVGFKSFLAEHFTIVVFATAGTLWGLPGEIKERDHAVFWGIG